MQRMPSVIDPRDVDEATYLLAAIQAPALADRAAQAERQAEAFAAAEREQREQYEEARRRQSQEYERRVQDQNAKFAAAMQEHTQNKEKIKKSRRSAMIAGLICLAIAALAFFLDYDSYGTTWSIYVVAVFGLVGIFLSLFGMLRRGPAAPAAPAPIEAPPPLDPPTPLAPPPPIPLPALPALAKAYWQVTVVPFGQDRSLIVNPQFAQSSDARLPEIDLAVVNATLADDRDLAEPEALRSLHRLHQALTARFHTQSLYLLSRDAPLGPVIEELLSATPPDDANLDAPVLPGAAEAGVEQMRQAVAQIVAFAERPFGIQPEAARTLLNDAVSWSERTAASTLERLLARTTAPAPMKPAAPTTLRPADTPAQALARLFDQVIADLHTDVDSQMAGAEAQAEERRGAANRDFETDRRKAAEDQQAVVRRLDDQAADFEQQLQVANSAKQQAEAKLKQATHTREILENATNEARSAYAASVAEGEHLEKEYGKADTYLQALENTIESLRVETQAAQPRLEQAISELTQIEQRITDLQAQQTKTQTDAAAARAELDASEQEYQQAIIVRRLDDQIADLERQRQEAHRAKQQAEARLQQATRAREILEKKTKDTSAVNDAAAAEDMRQKKEREKADMALQRKLEALDTQAQASQPGPEQATSELTRIEQRIADLEAKQTRIQADAVAARKKLEASQRDLEKANESVGAPVIVISDVKQRMDVAADAYASAEQAVQAVAAEISAEQDRKSAPQKEIAASRDRATLLNEKEAEARTQVRVTEKLESQLEAQTRAIDARRIEMEQLEREWDLANELREVEVLQEEVTRHQQLITELDARIESVKDDKKTNQERMEKHLIELQQARNAALKDTDAWLAQQHTLITSHIAQLTGQRDRLLKQNLDTQDDLQVGQLDQALLAYRKQALEEKRGLVQQAISVLGGQLDAIQEQIQMNLWTVGVPSDAEMDCLIPIWFSKPDTAWEVLAAGRTFLAQPVTRDQGVNASLTATADPLISFLKSSQIATRHAELLEQHLQSPNPVALAEQARALESARLIDGEMRAYLEQAR